MLFKEKKPSEYTKGRGGESNTETDTRHRPKRAAHRQGNLEPKQGPGGGRAEDRQPWAVHMGWVRLGRAGRSHTVRGARHLTETRPGPADTATGPRRKAGTRVAHELKLETAL